ncbi:MAG: hypothetical protein PW792_00545 [Acidobacteriaceae bacterium]|nr:hypothetical protein [Acidobacteriaceae bacterium]
MAAPRRMMTPAFRKRMLRDAAAIFGGLLLVLFVLVKSVPEKVFLVAAFVLIPVTALAFNFQIRRAYNAQQKKR